MKNFLFILLFLLSVATNQAVCQTVETDEKSEPENVEQQERQLGLDDLQGGWRINSVSMWGVNVKSDKEMPQNLFFENDVMIVDSGEEEPGDRSRMTIEIIEAQPVQINFMREKDGKQEVLPGIIERADGILKIALPAVPAEPQPGEVLSRPISFDDTESPFLLFTASKQEEGR